MENQDKADKTMENYLKQELYQLIKTDETIFDFIQESSLDGIWYWDLEKPENEWISSRFWTAMGYDPAQMPHQSSAWLSIINPDDLKVVNENFVKHCENPDHPYDQVVRYKHKNGSTVWIHCRGLAIRDHSGKPVRMLGAHIDITKLKQAELKLTQKHIILRTIIDKIPDAIYVKDSEARKIMANQADFTNCGFESEEEALGKTDFDIYPQAIAEQFFVNDQKVLKEGKSILNVPEKLTKKNGETIWLNTSKLPLHNEEGQITGIVGVGRDITQQKKAEEEKTRLLDETQRMNQLMNGREDRIIELKKQVNELSLKLNEGIVYKSVEDNL